jgi:hypothetical protein
MSMLVFWVVTPCGLVGRYQRFGETEDGGSRFLRNIDVYPHGVTRQKPISTTSLISGYWRAYLGLFRRSRFQTLRRLIQFNLSRLVVIWRLKFHHQSLSLQKSHGLSRHNWSLSIFLLVFMTNKQTNRRSNKILSATATASVWLFKCQASCTRAKLFTRSEDG